MSKDKLKLALSVISGRLTDLDYDSYDLLGYESYNFSFYEKPSMNELKEKCEEIVLDAIVNSSLCVPIFNETREGRG